MVTPVDFEALQVIRWMGNLELGSLTDPALILTEMQDYLGYMKRTAGIVDAPRTIAAAAAALAAAFATTEPIKATDRAAIDKLRRVLWSRCKGLGKATNPALIEEAITGLMEQGKCNAATVSISTVSHLASQLKALLLDQLLIDASEEPS